MIVLQAQTLLQEAGHPKKGGNKKRVVVDTEMNVNFVRWRTLG
jgi:hypothetical protein